MKILNGNAMRGRNFVVQKNFYQLRITYYDMVVRINCDHKLILQQHEPFKPCKARRLSEVETEIGWLNGELRLKCGLRTINIEYLLSLVLLDPRLFRDGH